MIIDLKPYAYDEAELLELYGSVGWTNYTAHPERLQAACAGSLYTLGAYADEELVGLVRCVGDGSTIVYVQDLLVRPAYQRRGIGTLLLRTVLERFADVYQLVLLTDDTPKTVAFYKSLGFTRDGDMNCCAFLRMKA